MTQTPRQSSLTVLAIETSCDETAVAILRDSQVLASEVGSQIAEHEKYGGVVPEIASRNHLLNAPRLIDRALASVPISLGDVDAFAATSGPGLAGSLMIGASIAKGMAIASGKPYLAINHLEGHLLSPFMASASSRCLVDHRQDADATIPRHVALIVSGGHTLLVHVRRPADYQIIGRTVDDAAGEAFDKVAKLLGLCYPGGPAIERLARKGNATRFDFPRSMSGSLDFSFSGLKTAVRYLLPKLPAVLEDDVLHDLCASFQQAVIDVLVEKTLAAVRKLEVQLVTLSGGVSANGALCQQMSAACKKKGLEFRSAPSSLCTDNAAMIGFAAMLRVRKGYSSSVEEEIDPNLALA